MIYTNRISQRYTPCYNLYILEIYDTTIARIVVHRSQLKKHIKLIENVWIHQHDNCLTLIASPEVLAWMLMSNMPHPAALRAHAYIEHIPVITEQTITEMLRLISEK